MIRRQAPVFTLVHVQASEECAMSRTDALLVSGEAMEYRKTDFPHFELSYHGCQDLTFGDIPSIFETR